MAPELVRFYGGSPTDWLRLPWSLARSFHEAIPQVRQREHAATGAAFQAPVIAQPERPAKRPRTIEEMRAHLAGIGIAVEEVKRG